MTQRKLPGRVNPEVAAGSAALIGPRVGVKAVGGGIGGAGSIWQKLTIETGRSSVKPENLRRFEESGGYQLCIVPSSLRLMGK